MREWESEAIEYSTIKRKGRNQAESIVKQSPSVYHFTTEVLSPVYPSRWLTGTLQTE